MTDTDAESCPGHELHKVIESPEQEKRKSHWVFAWKKVETSLLLLSPLMVSLAKRPRPLSQASLLHCQRSGVPHAPKCVAVSRLASASLLCESPTSDFAAAASPWMFSATKSLNGKMMLACASGSGCVPPQCYLPSHERMSSLHSVDTTPSAATN